jgi:hypothetical protein
VILSPAETAAQGELRAMQMIDLFDRRPYCRLSSCHPSHRDFAIAGLVSLLLAAFSLTFASLPAFAQSTGADASGKSTYSVANSAKIGPGEVVVKSEFGGEIFGFDIDQNGTEGLLAEANVDGNGTAVETFDQSTGKILKVVSKLTTADDFIALGISGSSVGLVEHEHVKGIYVNKRTYNILNPLSKNAFTGTWKPPIGKEHIITEVSHTQGSPEAAIFAYDNSDNFIPYVFESNVAEDTFGPIVHITDSYNFGSVPPPIAFDTTTNQVIMGGGDGCFGCLPVIGLVDVVKGTFSEFTGVGYGFVNGIAVDSADGIFCTTTEDDAGVEIYNLADQSGFEVFLPGSGEQQYYSGGDVEFDPINKLFLVAQQYSSSGGSGSAIYVYDTNGNLQETMNGFSFLVTQYVALNPANRTGYVNGPTISELQSFTY